MSAGQVLIVDDERAVRQVLQEFLAGEGYDVTLAGNGGEALDVLRTLQPEVVLLDVSMPGMDGAETLRRIVELRPALPVIMVTANADLDVTSSLLQMGAADYVPKPFELSYLSQTVSMLVAAARDREPN